MRNKHCLLFVLTFLIPACEFEDVEPLEGTGGNKITITTSDATDITQYTAKIAGTLSATYGRIVQEYGHCWGTSSSVEISGNHTAFDSADASFSFNSTLNGLIINTTYYARAYFIIDNIVIYGNEITFNTLSPTAPVVETVNIDSIDNTTAKCTYKIISDGGSVIIQRGICYSTSTNPDIINSLHSAINDQRDGTCSEYILGLYPNTTYYIRAYAKNTVGITYGNEISFKTKE